MEEEEKEMTQPFSRQHERAVLSVCPQMTARLRIVSQGQKKKKKAANVFCVRLYAFRHSSRRLRRDGASEDTTCSIILSKESQLNPLNFHLFFFRVQKEISHPLTRRIF